MSSSSNLRISRRRLLALALAWPLVARAADDDPVAGLTRWGSGAYRRFGFLVYEASLWAAGPEAVGPPLALVLTYRRTIAGKLIAEASVREMRNLGVASETTLAQWGAQMAGIFPDVAPGDTLIGVYRDDVARFYGNGRLLGTIRDAAFARAFFAIWLDEKTSAPALRAALLTRPAS